MIPALCVVTWNSDAGAMRTNWHVWYIYMFKSEKYFKVQGTSLPCLGTSQREAWVFSLQLHLSEHVQLCVIKSASCVEVCKPICCCMENPLHLSTVYTVHVLGIEQSTIPELAHRLVSLEYKDMFYRA